MPRIDSRRCRECGGPLPEGSRHDALFCQPAHRKAFNNRRMVRGAELYDLFMAIRYERSWSATKNLFTVISNLARAYRDADKSLRDGRKSWNATETIARLPLGFGSDGDGR